MQQTAAAAERIVSISYVFDDFYRLISKQTPDDGLKIFNYDALGLLVASIDAIGNITKYSYDKANRLIAVNPLNAADGVRYYYDQTGNIEDSGVLYANTAGMLTTVETFGMDKAPILSHYSYDKLGRMVDNIERQGSPAKISSFKYLWGKDDQLISLTYPNGFMVRYEYPASGGMLHTPDQVELRGYTMAKNYHLSKMQSILQMEQLKNLPMEMKASIMSQETSMVI